MAAWEDDGPRRPAGVDGRAARASTTSRPAARSTCRWTTARSWRRATPRPSTRVKFDGRRPTCRTITAFRLELLNDPNLPLRRARAARSRAPCALTEFEVEAAPGRRPGRSQRRSRSSAATADVEPAGDAAGADLRRQARNRKRVTGPVAFAIDGKDETAWGIDAGPGRRNVPRKAVFVAEKPIELPGRRRADVLPRAEPRRLEQRRQPEQQPRPLPPLGHRRARRRRPTRCPRGVREILGDPARAAHAGADRRGLRLLADDRARVEGGQRPDRGALEAAPGRARRSWCSRREASRGRRTSSSAATSSSRPSRSAPGVPGVPASAARRTPRRRA